LHITDFEQFHTELIGYKVNYGLFTSVILDLSESSHQKTTTAVVLFVSYHINTSGVYYNAYDNFYLI